MLSTRSTHYWLWFILFGVISTLAVWHTRDILDAESFWLLVTGFLGVLFGIGGLAQRFARPYDLIIGVLFSAFGVIGLLHNLGYDPLPVAVQTNDQAALNGLSLALPYALIHTLLGLTSLNHGLSGRSLRGMSKTGASSHAA